MSATASAQIETATGRGSSSGSAALVPAGEEYLARALEMVPNTAPFDVTGHPATSVPAGLVEGLPVGMVIVGRQFEDATCLRVANRFEEAVGGFPGAARRRDVGAQVA